MDRHETQSSMTTPIFNGAKTKTASSRSATPKTDNERYVQRGRDMVIKYDPRWEDDLKAANRRKVGAPFRFAERLIMFAAALRAAQGVKFRQLEGMIDEMLGDEYRGPKFSTLCKRINKMKIDLGEKMIIVASKRVLMAIDATGLKQHNRGEWMQKKWKTERRGFVKLHILVDTDSKKIIAASITDEKVGDSKMFESLLGESIDQIEQAEQNPDTAVPVEQNEIVIPVETVGVPAYPENHLAAGIPPIAPPAAEPIQHVIYADAGYSSRKNIDACRKKNVEPRIAHRITSGTRSKGTTQEWGNSVRDQFAGSRTATNFGRLEREEKRENQTYWKARKRYGKRWVVEYVFSVFKRLFGEHLNALKWENKVQEVKIRINLYNKWRDDVLAKAGRAV